MNPIRLRSGVIEQIKRDRNVESDSQVAAILGITPQEVEQMRYGARISPAMALRVASVQGTGFDLSEWVEFVVAGERVSA